MKELLLSILLFIAAFHAGSQDVTQTVKGEITDVVTGAPLPGASLRISNVSGDVAVTQANEQGEFQAVLAVGRYRLTVSYTGYRTQVFEMLVIAGKETIINTALAESSEELQSVEVTDTPLPAELPGMRSLSIEKTLRVPANFFDPVRVATAYPGVQTTNDQNNSIIVRGNSPNGLLWRLNGLDVVNPNHQANAGTLSDKPAANGGGVNILSAQMLDRTDFYTGALPANYGNVLAGAIDMRLRNGNTDHFEYTAKASLIGLDFAAEGPLGKGKNSSFLANYRYSTVGLLSKLGVDFGGESISFQDLSFHLHSDIGDGRVSVFGFWGNGKNEFDAKAPEAWAEDKDLYDIDYSSVNAAAGMTYDVPAGPGKISAGIAYSFADQNRTAIASDAAPPDGVFLLADEYFQHNRTLSTRLSYQVPAGDRLTWDTGIMANFLDNDVESWNEVRCAYCPSGRIKAYGGVSGDYLLQPFTTLNVRVSPALSIDAGARYMHFAFNNTGALEPRLHGMLMLSERSTLDMSYGLVSQIQLAHVYGARGNTDLGLTRSHHADAAITYGISEDLRLRTGMYYQYLFDVPIESSVDDPESVFSTLNLNEDPVPANLVNEGTGRNYGLDMTLERSFYDDHYFLIGGSYYDSEYTPADGISRDTRFNGRFTLSSVYGREWVHTEKGRAIGVNTRLLYLGGLLQREVDATRSELFWQTVYDDIYSQRMADYFRIDLRVSFRKNKPGYTRTFAIDIQNVTNQKNEAYQYYDFTQQQVVTKFQLGIIPVLVYRIDF